MGDLRLLCGRWGVCEGDTIDVYGGLERFTGGSTVGDSIPFFLWVVDSQSLTVGGPKTKDPTSTVSVPNLVPSRL